MVRGGAGASQTGPVKRGSTRAQVFAYISNHPGVCIAEVAASVGVDWTTSEYHVRRLICKGAVVERRVGQRRLLFPRYMDVALPVETLVTEPGRTVLEALRRRAPATATALATDLARARSGVLRHLTRLEDLGLVRRSNHGPSVFFMPADASAHVRGVGGTETMWTIFVGPTDGP